MKNFSAKLILAISVVFTLLASCKKQDVIQPAADNTAALIQNKNWKITAANVNPAYYGMTDIYLSMEDCSKDNLWRFSSPDIMVFDEGASKCDPADPQTRAATWIYNSTTKMLTITDPLESDSMSITQINDNSFTGKSKQLDTGITYTFTWTFTKQ